MRISWLFVGCLSGILYSLSIPAVDMGILAWICLVPSLLLALHPNRSNANAGRIWMLGLATGLAAGTGRVYWVGETLVNYGGLNQIQALLTTCALVLYIALYPAFFFLICRSLPINNPFFSWLAAAIWVMLDWAQSWIATGFPWQQIGYSQHLNLPVLQFASVSGVYGLSFIVVLVNATLSQAFLIRHRHFMCIVPVIVTITVIVGFGNYRIARLQSTDNPVHARIAIIQGNISQDIKWKINRIAYTTNHYVKLTREFVSTSAANKQYDLIVFPETALPFFLTDPAYSKYFEQVADLARELDTPILIGSLESRLTSSKIYNRTFLMDRSGDVVDFTDKVHLVPFGEYLPMPWLFSYLEELTAESGRFTQGDSHKTMGIPQTNLNLGVFICYESIFPEIARTLARDKANILINTTNDAWFGHTSAPHQHMAMATVRAVECGLPLVRVANTGISGAVAPSGQILSATNIFETAALSVDLPSPATPTLYVQHGNVLLIVCSIGIICALVVCRIRHRQEQDVAKNELRHFASNPSELSRSLVLLHGYNSDFHNWDRLLDHLRKSFSNLDTHLVCPDLNRNHSITELAMQLPTSPADYIGHSLGGIVAVEGSTGNTTNRIFALSSPLRGTWMAILVKWMKRPFPKILTDLIPKSSYLTARSKSNVCSSNLISFRINGDPMSTTTASFGSCDHREYSGGWNLWLPNRHHHILKDPRVIRDIIALLRRNENIVDA